MQRGELIKLVRILGMLGSDHPGERASAALAAHRWIQNSGTSWGNLLLPPPVRGTPVPDNRPWIDPFTDRLRAADSRMRQLRQENERFQRELKRLRAQLRTRYAPPGRGDA